MSEDGLSPSEAKQKFQQIADSEFAEKLQGEEFSSLRGVNVTTSRARHQNVTVGSRVANKVALQEETLHKIVETERLKREEMDKTLADKLQDREGGEETGVQTWLSRELIGFNHTKNRIQERKDEQIAQQIQDEEMAVIIQEKEDKKIANNLEEMAIGEYSSLKLARSLSKPGIESHTFVRTGSGGIGRPPVPPPDTNLPRSRTFGSKIESPVLKSKPHPLTTKKSNPALQNVIKEAPIREMISIGSVPKIGHPFLQTAADQQLFKEREMSLDSHSNPFPPAPPMYSQIDQSNVSVSSLPVTPTSNPESDQSDSLFNSSDIVPGDCDSLSLSEPPGVEVLEGLTPVPPPPFTGVSPSKLRHNKKRK